MTLARTHLTPLQKERRRRFKQVALWTGVGLLSYELFIAIVVRRQNRRDVYNQAVKRANVTQKSLIVVGSPDGSVINGALGRDYDCGDLCIDERGCPKCAAQAVGGLAQVLPTLPTNSAVIFIAGTLESTTDMPKVVSELQRVSGGDLFVASIEPWTITSLFGKRKILKAPPKSDRIEWKSLPWRQQDSGSQKITVSTGGYQKLMG